MKFTPFKFAFVVFASAALALLARAVDAAQPRAQPANEKNSLLVAPSQPAAPRSPADVDHDAVWAIFRDQPSDPDLRKNDPQAWFRSYDQRMQRFVAAGRAYAEKYPTDPRRREALIQSSYARPYFLTGFKPEFDAAPREANLTVDQPALAAFWEAQLKYLTEIIEASDSSLRHRGGAMLAFLTDSGALARLRGATFDIESAGPLAERVLAKIGDETVLPVIDIYLDALKRANRAAAVAAFEAKVQAQPKVAALFAEQQAKRAAAAEARAKKLNALANLRFTAVDGREVDLQKLKGKVVLIDFWATWCGPCIAELPNVKKVYAAYHERGFEVIGITLENSTLSGKETPEQAAPKLARAKQKLTEFTAKNEMPWPQYFDGLHWKNPYREQFGVEMIPAMFLLDKNGNLASTEARGEKLEAEVKRLLGL